MYVCATPFGDAHLLSNAKYQRRKRIVASATLTSIEETPPEDHAASNTAGEFSNSHCEENDSQRPRTYLQERFMVLDKVPCMSAKSH